MPKTEKVSGKKIKKTPVSSYKRVLTSEGWKRIMAQKTPTKKKKSG